MPWNSGIITISIPSCLIRDVIDTKIHRNNWTGAGVLLLWRVSLGQISSVRSQSSQVSLEARGPAAGKPGQSRRSKARAQEVLAHSCCLSLCRVAGELSTVGLGCSPAAGKQGLWKLSAPPAWPARTSFCNRELLKKQNRQRGASQPSCTKAWTSLGGCSALGVLVLRGSPGLAGDGSAVTQCRGRPKGG